MLAQTLQTLFVCTGCDYISFFSGMGKATFLRYFFQYASFITGANAQGSLTNIQLQGDDYKHGFLAFLRLVGTVYFKKHASGFDTPSPASHLLNINNGLMIYDKILQIDVHLTTACYHQRKHYTITGKDHAGCCTCGPNLTKTTWY